MKTSNRIKRLTEIVTLQVCVELTAKQRKRCLFEMTSAVERYTGTQKFARLLKRSTSPVARLHLVEQSLFHVTGLLRDWLIIHVH